MIGRIEIAVIVIAGMVGAYLQFRYYWSTRHLNSWRWVKLLFAIVCFAWSALFIGASFGISDFNLPDWHQKAVLPLVMVTVVTIAVSAAMRMRTKS